MSVHVGKMCSKAFGGLYNIRQIRKVLSTDTTKSQIHAFVTSHEDYCLNALLAGIPQYQVQRIQRVLNAAARLIHHCPRFSQITPVLIVLHSIPVKYWVEFKIALLVYKALNNMAPIYISELLIPGMSYVEIRANARKNKENSGRLSENMLNLVISSLQSSKKIWANFQLPPRKASALCAY
jgi:hypothetical protein